VLFISDDIFSDMETQKDNPIEIALSNALELLTNALINDTTNISKRELKALAILKQNKFIWSILKDYLPYKKQVNNSFEKSIQKAIEKISISIGSLNTEKESDGKFTKFFNRFR